MTSAAFSFSPLSAAAATPKIGVRKVKVESSPAR